MTEHRPSKKTVAPTNRATRVDWVKEYAHKIRVKNNAEPAALTPWEANEAIRQAYWQGLPVSHWHHSNYSEFVCLSDTTDRDVTHTEAIFAHHKWQWTTSLEPKLSGLYRKVWFWTCDLQPSLPTVTMDEQSRYRSWNVFWKKLQHIHTVLLQSTGE